MRRVVLSAVVTAHVFAIYCLAWAQGKRSIRVDPTVAPLIVFFTDDLKKPDPTEQMLSPAPAASNVSRSMTPARPAEPPPKQEPSEPASNAITDWYGEAENVANETRRRERASEALRSFTHQFAPSTQPEKPGIFGSQQRNHRAGTVENGDLFWVTDNCYFESKREAPLPYWRAPASKTMPTCKPPPTGGGDNMFEDLAPGYLKKPSTAP